MTFRVISSISLCLFLGSAHPAFSDNRGSLHSGAIPGHGYAPDTDKVAFDTDNLQSLRGETHLITVKSGGIEITGFDVSPPDGVVIKDLTLVETFTTYQERAFPHGHKRWTARVEVSNGAALGKRRITVLTAKGRSKNQPLTIITHRPVLSNLVVQGGALLTFLATFDVFDEGGDFPNRPYMQWHLGNCPGAGSAFGKYTAIDDKRGRVEFAGQVSGLALRSPTMCKVYVHTEDRNGNKTTPIHKSAMMY